MATFEPPRPSGDLPIAGCSLPVTVSGVLGAVEDSGLGKQRRFEEEPFESLVFLL